MITRSDIGELIERCRKKDRKAQQILYESYYDRYYTLSLRYVKDHNLACEMVNQLFFKVFTKMDQLREDGLLEGWMKQICINLCLNEIKKQKKLGLQDIDATPVEQLPQISNDGMENLQLKELMDLVLQLPPRMRVIFNLYVIDNYSHKEIGEQLKISAGTSKFHLNQARLRLQELVKKNYAIEPSMEGGKHG